MELYHFQLGIPKQYKTNYGIMSLKYSRHAQMAASSDRYGYIQLPNTLDTSKAQAVEVEIDSEGCISKILYRTAYDDKHDLCLAIIPNQRFVKTVWLNVKTDKHETLDTFKYTKAT